MNIDTFKRSSIEMIPDFFKQFTPQIQTFALLLSIINALLHLIFAGAVARDAGALYKTGQRTALVSAATWAFSTLIGGVLIAAIYWFIHHSTLTRPIVYEAKYDRN